MSASEMAKKLEITRDGVRYHLNKLKIDGVIEHIGTSKTGYWVIIKKNEYGFLINFCNKFAAY